MRDMPNWSRFVQSVLSGGKQSGPDKGKNGEEEVIFASSLTSEKGGANHGKKQLSEYGN